MPARKKYAGNYFRNRNEDFHFGDNGGEVLPHVFEEVAGEVTYEYASDEDRKNNIVVFSPDHKKILMNKVGKVQIIAHISSWYKDGVPLLQMISQLILNPATKVAFDLPQLSIR